MPRSKKYDIADAARDRIMGKWEGGAVKAARGATKGGSRNPFNTGRNAARGAVTGANPRKNTARRSGVNTGRSAASGAVRGAGKAGRSDYRNGTWYNSRGKAVGTAASEDSPMRPINRKVNRKFR